jgi:hypothetical protein
MNPSTLKASEIAVFSFCARAWWYARQGIESANVERWAAGEDWHRRHGRRVMEAGCLRALGYAFVLAAVLAAAVYATARWMG